MCSVLNKHAVNSGTLARRRPNSTSERSTHESQVLWQVPRPQMQAAGSRGRSCGVDGTGEPGVAESGRKPALRWGQGLDQNFKIFTMYTFYSDKTPICKLNAKHLKLIVTTPLHRTSCPQVAAAKFHHVPSPTPLLKKKGAPPGQLFKTAHN